MPVDLFEQEGLTKKNEPKDLFQEAGINLKPSEESGILPAIKSGFEQSATGLGLRALRGEKGIPAPYEPKSFVEKAAMGTAGMVSELPEMVAGGIAGGALGGIAGTEVPVIGNVAGAVVGGGAGTFALPAAIREAARAKLAPEEADLGKSALEIGKQALLGAVTGGVGKVAKAVLPTGIVSKVGVPTAEIGTMATGGTLLEEGRLPTAEELALTALPVAGLHIAGKFIPKGKSVPKPETIDLTKPAETPSMAYGQAVPEAFQPRTEGFTEDISKPLFTAEGLPARSVKPTETINIGGKEYPVAPAPVPSIKAPMPTDYIEVGGQRLPIAETPDFTKAYPSKAISEAIIPSGETKVQFTKEELTKGSPEILRSVEKDDPFADHYGTTNLEDSLKIAKQQTDATGKEHIVIVMDTKKALEGADIKEARPSPSGQGIWIGTKERMPKEAIKGVYLPDGTYMAIKDYLAREEATANRTIVLNKLKGLETHPKQTEWLAGELGVKSEDVLNAVKNIHEKGLPSTDAERELVRRAYTGQLNRWVKKKPEIVSKADEALAKMGLLEEKKPAEILPQAEAKPPVVVEKPTPEERLNVRYEGEQELRGGKKAPMYTDLETKSSFVVPEGTTLEKRVSEIREKFKPQKFLKERLAETKDLKEGDFINKITLGEATKRLAEGDKTVIPHLEQGVKNLGVDTMQHNIRNKVMGAIYEKGKKEGVKYDEAIKDYQKIAPEVNKVLSGEKAVSPSGEIPSVSETKKPTLQSIKEKIAEKEFEKKQENIPIEEEAEPTAEELAREEKGWRRKGEVSDEKAQMLKEASLKGKSEYEALKAKYEAEANKVQPKVEKEIGKIAEERGGKGEINLQVEEAKRTEKPFFSQLERTIEQKMPNRMSAGQLRNMIKGLAKEDEIKWTGLDDYLKEHPFPSKQEVLDFVRQNRVEIKEVEKTGQYGYGTPSEHIGTKFHQWQTPGGENYREMLLTLPKMKRDATLEGIAQEYYQEHYEDLSRIQKASVQDEYSARKITGSAQEYKSPHWNEPNVLAHIRMNDRIDAEGKKVLFIEEIQSDWHQEGKRKGYREKELPEGYKVKENETPQYGGVKYYVEAPDGSSKGGLWGGDTKAEAIERFNSERVPPAPFSKTWHELALKRMLRYAAENGYDKIAWTTGEMQAERYDLSKHIGELTWHKEKTPQGYVDEVRVVALSPDKGTVEIERTVKTSELENLVGKEIAQKIIDDKGKTLENKYGASGTLSGLDLKVGGEGMKGFYDKILPDFLNKYGKKWGARVEEDKIFTSTDIENKRIGIMPTEEAIREGKKHTKIVPSLDITPSMKESVLYEGQPLFQTGKEKIPLPHEQLSSIIDHALKILPEGSKIVTKDQIEITPEQLRSGIEKYGKDFIKDNVVIKGLHKNLVSGDRLVSYIEYSNKYGDATTIPHEVWHGMRDFLSDNERTIISKVFKTEEAEANAFGRYWTEQAGGKKTFISKSIRAVFEKIKTMIQKTGNYLKGLGFKSTEDVFEKVYKGEVETGKGIPRSEEARLQVEEKPRKFLKRVQDIEDIPEKVRKGLKEIDPQTYKVKPNAESVSKADIYIQEHGLTEAREYVLGDITPENEAMRSALFQKLIKEYTRVNKDEAIKLYDEYDKQLRESGRFVQAAAMVKSANLFIEMEPALVLRYFEKQIAKANENRGFVSNLVGRGKVELSDAMKKDILRKVEGIQKMPEGVDKTNQILSLVDSVAKQVPPSVSELIDAFRYQNMLSGFKTQERNIGENAFNTFVTRPYDLGMEATIDFVGSTLQGKPRQVYLKDVASYYKNTLNAVPMALDAFKSAWKMERGFVPEKPELGFIEPKEAFQKARARQMPKSLTIVQRFMEASDKFFSTLITSGEYNKLIKSGMEKAQAEVKAKELAEKYLYRNKLDPKNPDLSVFSKGLSSLGKIIEESRHLPAIGKPMGWFIPFLRTPLNKGIQMIERSPFGFIRNRFTRETTAKALGGSMVTAIGATFALMNESTWSAPTGEEEKKYFYASGRKPYSVKIGDTWIPIWYLGPFALAFAIPAAIKFHSVDSKASMTNEWYEKMGNIAAGIVRLIGSQTSAQSIGNFFSLMAGDIDLSIEQNLAFMAGQAVPASALIRQVNTMIDPIYRKPNNMKEQFTKDIPFLSQELVARRGPKGEEQKRNPFNSLLPYDIGNVEPSYESKYPKIERFKKIASLKNKQNQLRTSLRKKEITIENFRSEMADIREAFKELREE